MHAITFHYGLSTKVRLLLIFLSHLFPSPCNPKVPSTCRLFCFSATCPIALLSSLACLPPPLWLPFLFQGPSPHSQARIYIWKITYFFLVFLILSHLIYNHFHIHSFFFLNISMISFYSWTPLCIYATFSLPIYSVMAIKAGSILLLLWVMQQLIWVCNVLCKIHSTLGIRSGMV